MDITFVSHVMTSAIALAAVIGPIISSTITVKSNEKTKRFEQYAPQLYAAVHRFSNAYSDYPRLDDPAANSGRRQALEEAASYKYRELSAAVYDVISFIPDETIHDHAISLLRAIRESKLITAEEDVMFQDLSALLAKELTSQLSAKRKSNHRRAKRNSSK